MRQFLRKIFRGLPIERTSISLNRNSDVIVLEIDGDFETKISIELLRNSTLEGYAVLFQALLEILKGDLPPGVIIARRHPDGTIEIDRAAMKETYRKRRSEMSGCRTGWGEWPLGPKLPAIIAGPESLETEL